MKFSDYINYFKTAAINNIALAHVEGTHPTFYEIDIVDILSDLKLPNKYMSMLLESPEVRAYDEKGDNIRNLRTGAFVILKEVDRGDKVHRSTVLDECEEVVGQILSKMLNDTRKSRAQRGYTPRIELDVNSVRIQKVGPILTNHYGWRVEFTLNSNFNFNMALDESKWNNETKFDI